MKRLYSYLEDTFPFINDDFNNVLQDQHIIAYSAYLDGINDMKYSTQSTNRGIVLSGIDVTATPNQLASDKFSWQVKIGPNSLVYFDGQYYNPDSNLTNGDVDNVTLRYTNHYCLFIYPFTQSISRQFRNDQLGTQSFSIDYRFNIVPYGFPSNVPPLPYPGSTMGVPHILYEFGGTSRNLSRLLKLSTTVKDDIQITHNPKSWQTPVTINGWQFYSDGYIYRDFETKKNNTFTGFKLGRNELKGFAVLDDMGGRFMVGYDSTSLTTPVDGGLFDLNYGLISNYGGTQSLTFSKDQLPSHNHASPFGPGSTDPTTQNLDHSHTFLAMQADESAFGGSTNAKSIGYGSTPQNNEVFLTRSNPYWLQEINAGVQEEDVDFSNHKHNILSVGQDDPHENRPPYVVTLFYYKI